MQFCPPVVPSFYTNMLYFILCAVFSVAVGRQDRIPKPHTPGEDIVYPEDYCASITPNEVFDFIVVGAGPAGVTVARRLSQVLNFRVLLIESGGDPPIESDIPSKAVADKNLRWNFYTSPRPNECLGYKNNSCLLDVGRVLGGSSVINSMMYCRGNAEDYNEWAKLGNTGWDYESVLPYFKKLENFIAHPIVFGEISNPASANFPFGGFPCSKKMENFIANPMVSGETSNPTSSENFPFGVPETVSAKYHATGGPLTIATYPMDPQTEKLRKAILDAVDQNGIPKNIDTNGKQQIGVTNLPAMVDGLGYRSNAAKAYLLNIPDNLKVCKYSTVTRIRFDKKRATGVEFIYKPDNSPQKFLQVQASKETILSAGAMNSPAILERSGIGHPDVLQRAGVKPFHFLPKVGENFQDQYLNLGPLFQVDFGTQTAANPLNHQLVSLTMFANFTDSKSSVPDLQFIVGSYTREQGSYFKPQIAAQLNAIKQKLIEFSTIVLRPELQGSTHITQATDPEKSPEILSNQFVARRDIELTVKGVRFVRKIMSDLRLRRFKPEPIILNECKGYPFNSEDEIMCQARHFSITGYHNTGSCSMGLDPNTSVVDPQLRVHGIQSLRIIDSSVMPLVPRCNTQIPTQMVGEKGADLVKASWIHFKSLP